MTLTHKLVIVLTITACNFPMSLFANNCGGNQNNIYDPSVKPEGVYKTRNADDSINTTYSTGEKKPYFVGGENCNNDLQPQILLQPDNGNVNNDGVVVIPENNNNPVQRRFRR
jgi:hypothetical protein